MKKTGSLNLYIIMICVAVLIFVGCNNPKKEKNIEDKLFFSEEYTIYNTNLENTPKAFYLVKTENGKTYEGLVTRVSLSQNKPGEVISKFEGELEFTSEDKKPDIEYLEVEIKRDIDKEKLTKEMDYSMDFDGKTFKGKLEFTGDVDAKNYLGKLYKE